MNKKPTYLRWLVASIMMVFLWSGNYQANAQCLSATYGQWPGSTITVNCTSLPQTITASGWAGEYSVVAITAGTAYTFTSSVATDYITVSDAAGATAYAFGTTPVVWTSTVTGNVRFYTHTSVACGSAMANRTRAITCSPPPPPVNDLCADAITINCGDVVNATTANSTTTGAPTTCGETLNTAGGVWYKFTGNGLPATVSLCGSAYDTKLGVFSGTCGALVCEGANDDFCGLQSEVSFNSVNGTEYLVYVTGFGTNRGAFTLSLSCVQPGLEFLTPNLSMGYRPIGAWMEPARFSVVNNPGAGDLIITNAEIDNTYDGFVEVVAPAFPYTLPSGATTTEFGLNQDVEASAVPGAFNGTFAFIYTDSRALATATYDGTAYTPPSADVVETAFDLGSFSAPAGPISIGQSGSTRELNGYYKNYILPNDLGNGPQENDYVYKMTFLTDKLFSAATTATPNFAIYSEDFEGEPGPMAHNAVYQNIGSFTDVPLFAGTYYMVISDLVDWVSSGVALSINDMPVPDVATYVSPADGAININNGMSLNWIFGANTFEYEVVLGTTYPPTTVVVPFTSNLATSYVLAGLQPNMQYFWQVNTRNTQGTTFGPVWGFTTTIDVPTGLTASVVDPAPTASTVSVTLNWTGPSDRAFIGYNVYRDGVKINSTPLTESAYTDPLLARNTTYSYRVSNVFDEGESAQSAAVTVTTKGVGTFNGFVYDFLGGNPIEGARVDISGPAGSYSVLTAANGFYSTLAYAGTYDFSVSATGFTTQARLGQVVVHAGTTSNDFYLMEVPYPVGEVVAFELSDDQVQISWDGQGEPPIQEWLVYDADNIIYGGVGAVGSDYSLTWASKWVPDQLADFQNGSVTKVAVYQVASVGDYLTEVRILSGDGSTVLYAQDVTGSLVEGWNIIDLDQPVTFDNEDNLWIAMYVERPGGSYNEPISVALEVLSDRYDYFSYNGSPWVTLSGQYGLTGAAWMLRAYISYSDNREIVLGKGDYADEYKDYSAFPSVLTGLGLIPANAPNSKFPKYVGNNTRGIVSYDVWREKVYQPGTLELIGNTVQQNFVDFDWGIQDWGVYRWAVTVNYDAGQVSVPTFSNTLDKDMYTEVDVTVTLNSADSPAGTLVTFMNTSEPLLELVYEEALGNSGQFTWDSFRKGTYDIEVFKAGYTSVSLTGVDIFDATSFEWLLDEILAPPVDLYVTPTGLARWMGGSSLPFAPFMENFDGGVLPSGWVVEVGDQDDNGDSWKVVPPVTGRNFTGTPYLLVDSDAPGNGTVTHSILYTPVIDASNAATLYLEFDQYYRRISGDVSTVEVFDGSNWIQILNQTATTGSWTVPNHQTIDVSAYANTNFQVRFEYVGDWAWYWAVDNVELNEVVTRGADRSLVGFKVFHDGVLVAETADTQYQYGTNGEALVDGETYLAEVATVYSTGQSARAAYTWTYIACDNYATPGSFAAAQVEGTLDVQLSWTIPAIPLGDDQIDFARIYRDGEVIAEVITAGYLDEGLDLGSYEYCITFVYETGAETCPATICATAVVTGGGLVNGNVSQAAYLGGDPIEGAVLTLTNVANPTIVFTFVTDADGDYDGEVLAGTYDYAVVSEGYITATLSAVAIPQSSTVTRDFVLMEFPAPVELVIATELSDAAVQITWRTPGTILFEPSTVDFNDGLPADWTITDGGTTADTWEVVTSYSGSTLDGTPMAFVDSDGAGIGPILDEMMTSPVYNVLGTSELYLQFDQYYRHLGAGSYGKVEVFDGANWVTVLEQTATAGAFGAPNAQSIDVSAYVNAAFQVRFHYFDNGAWAWYWAVDNVTLTDEAPTRSLMAPPASTLAGYNVYRTTCATGALQFLGYTLDTLFNDNTWVSAEAGVYKWGVEAVYAANESEVRFSNCLDKDMITQVSVTVITNSLDSPEGTEVMLTNTSEPDLGLVYETELDATGYFMWEEFRKGTYDIHVELFGFEPIHVMGYVIDGPTNLSYILEELLLPVSDLHVSPTGYATWGQGGVIPFEPTSFDFEADAQGWEIQNVPTGWRWGNNTSLSSSFMNFNGNSTNFIAVNADGAGSGGAPIVQLAKSPVLDLSNAPMAYLNFDYLLRFDDLSVHYSIAGGAPVIIEQLDEYYTAGWASVSIELPEEALVADVQIVFLFEEASTWGYGAGVDNLAVTDEAPENARALVNYKVWLDEIFVTDTENQFWQYDASTLVPGQEYFSEVAAVYSNGISAKMNYTWVYYPCDSFPGPEDLTYEVVDINDVVLNWGGTAPPPPGGFEENFEGAFPPAGWAKLSPDGGTGWEAIQTGTTPLPGWTGGEATAAPDGGAQMAYASWESGGATSNDQWLVSPQLTAGTGDVISFYMRYWPDTYLDNVEVLISTASQTNVADFSTVVADIVLTTGSSMEWELYTYNLNDFVPAGTQFYLAFREVVADNFNDGAAIFIDNVAVGAPAQRAMPTYAGITSDNISRNYTRHDNLRAIGSQVVATSSTAGVNVSNREVGVLWGENWEDPQTSTNGIISTYYGGLSAPTWSADDFTVPAGEEWVVSSLWARGFLSAGVPAPEGFGYTIFADAGGAPGAVLYEEINTGTNDPAFVEIDLDTPVTMSAGTYWVSFYAYYATATNTAQGRWNQYMWNPAVTPGNPAMLDDAAGLFGGTGGFVTLSSLGVAFSSLDFAVIGEVQTGGGGGGGTFDPGEFLGANVYRDGVLIAEMVQAETYTDEDVAPGFYDYCVTFVYADGAQSCLSTCVLDVLVTEDCEVPQNLTATLVEENNEVTLVWNENISQEFRYDDGVSTGQLGFTGGTTSSVMGAVHTESAELTEISWYLTAEGGPHPSIQVYVFGLTSAGIPDGGNVLYTANVTNTDLTWNTHTFPAPVVADGGFFLAVGFDGFVGLGTDDGLGAPYVFQDNTHYYSGDYSTEPFGTWESVGFSFNALLRAVGVVDAVNSYAIQNGEVIVDNQKRYSSMVYTRLPEPVVTGEPQWAQEARSSTREFMGYNIYKDGALLEALWPETTYVYNEGEAGVTCYTVTAEYEFCGETDPSNEACIDIVTGVGGQDLANTRIYPNPSNSVVNIELPGSVSQVIVYNYLGQVVFEQNVTKAQTIQLNVRNYEAGAYLVKLLTNAGETLTKKVVVTH